MKRTFCTIIILLAAVAAFAQTGTWSGSLKVQNSSLLLVFNFEEGADATLDVPDQHASGIKATVARGDFGKVSIQMAALGARFEGLMLGSQIVGTFTQNGAQIPLTLKPGRPEIKRPQTPVGPFPYKTEEVSFANGDAVLKGTLSLPEGFSRSTPVLLMITGSGLQNRDEEVYEHRPFAVIADALARKGIATLRYDDRSFGESTGDAVNATTDDFRDDALAGIALLRERFDRVGVLGHSEGGSFALLIAADGKADFVVSLAGMVSSTAETLLRQNRDALLAAGIPLNQTEEYVRLLAKAFEATVKGSTPPSGDGYDIPAALKANYKAVLQQLATPYLKSSLTMEPRKVLGSIHCPVLALNGTLDTQVDCEENLGALEAGMTSGLTAVRLPDLNHLFQHCKTGDTSEYKDIEETMSPEVLEIIANWVKSL